jgi:RNA polymerase sigma-70 factor, ECF subfamily
MDLESLADEALMKRVRSRDVEAFRVLYSRYEARIFNFVLRYTGNRPLAEDLLQETFWRVWQAASSYDPARGEFRSWLYKVAINATRTEMGAKRRFREVPGDLRLVGEDPSIGTDPAEGPAGRFDRLETSELVARAMARLTPPLREIVTLRCLEGMKFHEISAVTGAPLGTLKSRFHRAVAELRHRLAPGEQ